MRRGEKEKRGRGDSSLLMGLNLKLERSRLLTRNYLPFSLSPLLPFLLSSDYRHQAAGFAVWFFLFAVGEKQIGAFHRAERRDRDVFLAHAGAQKLFPIRRVQINQRVIFPCRREKMRGIGEVFTEFINHVLSDFVIFTGCRRTDGGD